MLYYNNIDREIARILKKNYIDSIITKKHLEERNELASKYAHYLFSHI
jgi:hypothetical protein